MKIIAYSLIACLIAVGCKKDENGPRSYEVDYSAFSRSKTPSFEGKINESAFDWIFGWHYQSIKGYDNGNGHCDSTDPVRIVFFGLVSNDGRTNFILHSPKYLSTDEESVNAVFSVGHKKIGAYGENYHLVIVKDGMYYSSSIAAANELVVLKTEEYMDDHFQRNIRVWIKINAQLNLGSQLTDGALLAEFTGYRK